MRNKKTAFPTINDTRADQGISQRLYIAAQIISGCLSNSTIKMEALDNEFITQCYAITDELIKQDNGSN